MKLKFLLFTFTFGITLGTLTAQDIHFSLYNMSPLTLNPALTGAFEGTARAGGIYRSQWSSFLGKDKFATPSFYVDAPIIRGFRKKDWVGVGLVSYNDLAGGGRLQTTGQLLSASYHFALNKEGKTMLTLGIQGGSVTRKTGENYITGEFLETGQKDEDIKAGKKNYLDFAAGLMLRSAIGETSGIELGVAFAHITQPDYGFEEGSAKRPMTITGHAKYESKLTDKWSIAPTALYRSTAGASEIALQGWGGYQYNNDYKLNFGAGYRVSDAAQLLLGVDYKEMIRVAASYDVNVSSLNTVSNNRGGFEISAWYIFKIFKKPSVKPAILCPQF